MRIHLIDGTYELFRNFFGAPSSVAPDGTEVGATRGLCRTLLSLITKEGATHIAFAFDRVIKSFRNDLFDRYKTGESLVPELEAQFPLAEQAAFALGIVVWPMVEFEADDVLATAAFRWKEKAEQVLLCSPDKDLAQCVEGKRVVCLDRRREKILDEEGVLEKFGVFPRSIPDWLALVGDTADGIPGVPRWGKKNASLILKRYTHLEKIPKDASEWDITIRGKEGLAKNLAQYQEEVFLYRKLARLRFDVPIEETLPDLMWRGARKKALEAFCKKIGETSLLSRIPTWRTL